MPVAVPMITRKGEEHGCINILSNSVAQDGFAHMKPEHKKAMELMKKDDSKRVKAEYMNSRGRHERLTKPYCKYPGDPIEIWHFIPGQVYDVPMGLVNEVNDKNKVIPRRSGLVSVDGTSLNKDDSPLQTDQEGDWLHKFTPVGFH